MKVLVAEKSWMSPVAQPLHMDGDGSIPGAVDRKTQLMFQKSQKGAALLPHLKVVEFQERAEVVQQEDRIPDVTR